MSWAKASFSFLQKIGKALMLPVAVLPVAGILLGVGSAHFEFIPTVVSNIMAQSGGAIFGNVVMLATMGVFAKVMGAEVKPIMGIDSINTGVFGGIAIGIVAAIL